MHSLKLLLKKDVSSFLVRRFSSFTYLNVTQFLGALNDNIFKLLIVYYFIQLKGIESAHIILAITGAIFVLPFLLFSASSGTLADRFSKRNIIVLTKLFELIIVIGGIFSFYFESTFGPYCILFLLATHSALFAPSKYGIVPELVEEEKITKANGLMTSFTFLAIIIGTFSASFLLDITGRNFILASMFCATLSLVGLATSFCIEYTPPSGFHKRFNVLFLQEIYITLKNAYAVPSLLAAIFGSAFFLFLGAYVQLNIIPYSVNVLHLTDIQGGYVFLLTALGIGTGALLAGKISGRTVELGLVPFAGIGITVCCYMMDFLSDHILLILPLVMLEGVLGGIYQVPLDSYIQIASPNQYRGQIVAATNFLSYFGVLLASVLLYMVTEVFGYGPNKGFTILGTITLMVSIVVLFQFFDYLSRFIGMLLSRLLFKATFHGTENISDKPSIYVCTHTAWSDTLLMLGAQRRRMRFFVEQQQLHAKWVKKIYQLLRVVNIPEPLENSPVSLEEIKSTLKKGISVCIFLENPDICTEFKNLMNSYSMQEILHGHDIPIIPVSIEKGTKQKTSKLFKGFLEKIQVPANVSFGPLVCDLDAN